MLFQIKSFSTPVVLFSNNLLYFSLQLGSLREKFPGLDEHFIPFGAFLKNKNIPNVVAFI